MRHLLIGALCALLADSTFAQTATTTDAPATPVVHHAAKSTSKRQLDAEAKALALAEDTAKAASDNQLSIAARVLTGRASCEFNQTVSVDALEGAPGYFKVTFKNATYVMAPEETTTGAVRLLDKRNNIIWLQIPSKSMLMNAKLGQRMVDDCMHSEQRAAVAAAQTAGATMGIVTGQPSH